MSSNGLPESNKVLGFLKEYKVLECSCCQLMFGFQHRATGLTYCIGGCHEKGPQQPLLSANPISILSTIPPNIPFVNPVKANVEPTPVATVPASSAPLVVKAPKEVGRQETAPPVDKVAPAVKAVPKSVDSVDSGPKAAAPASAPAPAKPVKEEAKPAPVAKPVPVKPSNSITELKYSANLVCPNAQVRVQFMYDPLTLHVVADADETPLTDMQNVLGDYASKAAKMTRPPVKDEVVIGDYGGEPYRARVREVNGENCKIEFIDYGDATLCKYTELIAADEAIMKYPLFGMTVKLAKVPDPPSGFAIDANFEEEVYGQSFYLDPVQKSVKPAPGQEGKYEVRLWDLPRDGTLNEKMVLLISSALRGWTPLTLEEERELAYLTLNNSHFRANKQFIEESMRTEALDKKMPNLFIFKLDNADFHYTIRDLPLITPELLQGEVEVEIVKYNGLCDVIVRPVNEPFDASRNSISERLGNWMRQRSKDELNRLQKKFAPETEEMCVVYWPSWEIFYELMRGNFDEFWFADEEFYERDDLSICWKDFDRHAGKWFRAARVKVHNNPKKGKEETAGVYEMFLVDWGELTLIPRKHVYRMPHRFMIDYQMSLFTTVVLNEIHQYDYDSSENDDKWKHLLLPGLKIKVKIVWMYDEINIMTLIHPSEKQFDQHFRKRSVQEAIEKQKKLYNN